MIDLLVYKCWNKIAKFVKTQLQRSDRSLTVPLGVKDIGYDQKGRQLLFGHTRENIISEMDLLERSEEYKNYIAPQRKPNIFYLNNAKEKFVYYIWVVTEKLAQEQNNSSKSNILLPT